MSHLLQSFYVPPGGPVHAPHKWEDIIAPTHLHSKDLSRMYSDDCYDSLLHDTGLSAGSGVWSKQHSPPDKGLKSFDMSGLDFDRILSSTSDDIGSSVDTASSPLRVLWDFLSNNITFDASCARADDNNYPELRSNVVAPLTAPAPDNSATVTTVQPTMWQDTHQGLGLREILQREPEATTTYHCFASPILVSSTTTSQGTSPPGANRGLSTDLIVTREWMNYGPDAPTPPAQTRTSNKSLPSSVRREKRSKLRCVICCVIRRTSGNLKPPGSDNTSPYSMQNRESAGLPGSSNRPSDTSVNFIELNNLTFKRTLCMNYPQFSRYPEEYFYAEILNDISIRSVCLLCPADSGAIFTAEHATTVHRIPGSKRGDSDPFIFLSCCEGNAHKPKSRIVKCGALKRHFNSKAHSENRYQCPYCHDPFSRTESVARHLTIYEMLGKIMTEEDEKYTSDGGL